MPKRGLGWRGGWGIERVERQQDNKSETKIPRSLKTHSRAPTAHRLVGSLGQEKKVAAQGLDLFDQLAQRTVTELAVQDHVNGSLSQRELCLGKVGRRHLFDL